MNIHQANTFINDKKLFMLNKGYISLCVNICTNEYYPMWYKLRQLKPSILIDYITNKTYKYEK